MKSAGIRPPHLQQQYNNCKKNIWYQNKLIIFVLGALLGTINSLWDLSRSHRLFITISGNRWWQILINHYDINICKRNSVGGGGGGADSGVLRVPFPAEVRERKGIKEAIVALSQTAAKVCVCVGACVCVYVCGCGCFLSLKGIKEAIVALS